MKEFQLFALMNAGGSTSMQKVEMNDEGQLKVDAEITTSAVVTVESSGDELNADTLRVHQVGNAAVSSKAILVARQTNQTAASDAADTFFSADDLGRALTRVQARDLTQSAYVQLTNGTETTLLAAGGAGVFNDLLWIVAANNSDAATSIDLRSATSGTVLMTLQVPANSTTGANIGASPLKQEVAASIWTADLPDITGTTISISALFSKEV